jgi:hypothetical protein
MLASFEFHPLAVAFVPQQTVQPEGRAMMPATAPQATREGVRQIRSNIFLAIVLHRYENEWPSVFPT